MATLTILDSYDAPGRGPAGLAWDGRYLWNADYTLAKIMSIDLEHITVQQTLICPGSLSGLAWDGRALWQVLHMEGWARRINAATNDFDQTLDIAGDDWLSGVAWDGEQLWFASQQKGQLLAVDPLNGAIRRTIAGAVAAGGLTYHNGALWLAYPYPMVFHQGEDYFDWQGDEQHYALVEVDPVDGRVLAHHELDFLPMGLAWVGDDLWLAHARAAKLYRARLG
jgi:hypothetical protein